MSVYPKGWFSWQHFKIALILIGVVLLIPIMLTLELALMAIKRLRAGGQSNRR